MTAPVSLPSMPALLLPESDNDDDLLEAIAHLDHAQAILQRARFFDADMFMLSPEHIHLELAYEILSRLEPERAAAAISRYGQLRDILLSQLEREEDPAPAPTRSTHSAGIFNGVYNTLLYATSGFLGGYFFSLIVPMGGAVFGATSAIAEMATDSLIDRSELNSCLRTLLWAGAFFTNIAAGAFIASSLGFPITLTTACVLTLAMIPASLLVAKPLLNMALLGAKYAAACIGGGLLAIKDRLV